MEAPGWQVFLDPLCVLEETSVRTSMLSLDKPVEDQASRSGDSPSLSMSRQAADGSEDAENPLDQNQSAAADISEVLTHRQLMFKATVVA